MDIGYKPFLITIKFTAPTDILDIYRIIYSCRQQDVLLQKLLLFQRIDGHNNYLFNITNLLKLNFFEYSSTIYPLNPKYTGRSQEGSAPTNVLQFQTWLLELHTYNSNNPDIVFITRTDLKKKLFDEWMRLYP